MKLVASVLMAVLIGFSSISIAEAAKLKDKVRGAMKCEIRRIASGTTSGVNSCRTVVVQDQAAWQQLWKEHTSRQLPPPALPSVDFGKEMVLAVFAGTKSSTGYSVSINNIVTTAKSLKAKVATTSPPSGAITGQMLTQPFDIVAVPKSSLAVEWDGNPCATR